MYCISVKILCVLMIFFMTLFSLSNSAKILAYMPTPSISHQLPYRPLLIQLAKRGHEVTFLTTDPAFLKGKAPDNFTEIDLLKTSYKFWEKAGEYGKGKKNDYFRNSDALYASIPRVLDEQMKVKAVQDIINGKERFDLLILGSCFIGALAFAHNFNGHVIHISSMGGILDAYHNIGAPMHPLYYPLPRNHKTYNLSLWEKITVLYNNLCWFDKMNYKTENEQHKIIKKHFGEDMSPLSELKNKIDLMFLNIHPIFEGIRPVPPSVAYVWGIHNKTEKELPEDLKLFLDSSKHGVIYMSFGSNADPANLPAGVIQTFVDVFSKLPYDVLWKWNKDQVPANSKNIKFGKWFPQTRVLSHPKLKLFITQGGLQSTDEAIKTEVPLLGIPMLADQWYNTEKYEHFGIGIQLIADTLTENKFTNAVNTLIGDPSYRRNIKKFKNLLADEPISALDKAVHWVEHLLLENSHRYLRSPAANMSWVEYFELEFFLTLLAVILVIFFIVTRSVYWCYIYIRMFFCPTKKVKI